MKSFTRTDVAKVIRIGVCILVALVIIGYATLRSIPYAKGPRITILQPLDGSVVATSTVTVIGRAERVNEITMNGRAISIDEAGSFEETLLVLPGTNIISFDATDQFKRSEHAEIRIVGTN